MFNSIDSKKASIAAACVVLGSERKKVSEILEKEPGIQVDPRYEYCYTERSGDALSHCERAAEAIFNFNYVDPNEINIILLCSDLIIDRGRKNIRKDIISLQKKLGLGSAYPCPIFLSECGNFSLGIALARSLILSGQIKKALILSSESRGQPVISPNAKSVISDSAVAAIVEEDAGMGLCLEDFFLSSHIELAAVRASLPSETSLPLAMLTAARRTNVMHGEKLKTALESGAKIIYPNLPTAVKLIWARELGLPFAEGPDIDTMSEIAHAGPADAIMNLTKALCKGSVIDNDIVITLHPGSHVWNMGINCVGNMRYFRGYQNIST